VKAATVLHSAQVSKQWRVRDGSHCYLPAAQGVAKRRMMAD